MNISTLRIILASLLLFVIYMPRVCMARDIHIKNNPTTGQYLLDKQLVVERGDSLFVDPGTHLRVSGAGSIYSLGKLYVGNASSAIVQIDSETQVPVFKLNGGRSQMTNMSFGGWGLIEGYNYADIQISNLKAKVLDLGSNHNYNQSLISIFNSSKLSLLNSHINDFSKTSFDQTFGRHNLFEFFASTSAYISGTYIQSNNSDIVFSIYGHTAVNFENLSISSCALWFSVYGDSKIEGTANHSQCTSVVQEVFLNSTSSIVFIENKCCSSVFYIPGIQGSRLYKKQIFENQLWEPNRNLDVEKLLLNSIGISIDKTIYTKDIIRKINVLGNIFNISIYDTFIGVLENMRDQNMITDFTAWSYDWRYSPETIVDQNMLDSIYSLASNSKNGKVTIIAHSYGGLVTKELLSRLVSLHKENLIDDVVFVAVPESGAPQSIFSILHGYVESIGINLITKTDTLYRFIINMPGIYQLLPNNDFASSINIKFSKASEKTSSVLDTSDAIRNNQDIPNYIGTWIRDQISFLLDKPIPDSAIFPKTNGISHTLPFMNGSLILSSSSNSFIMQQTKLSNQRRKIQDSVIESTFDITSIIGLGIQTLNGLDYKFAPCVIKPCMSSGFFTAIPIYSDNGDGTVIYDSPSNRIGRILPINLERANSRDKTNIKHGDIMESKYIQKTIKQIILKEEIPLKNGSIDIGDITSGVLLDTNGILISTSDIKSHYSFAVSGNIVGGIVVKIGTSSFQTLVLNDKEKISTIEQIPNSSIHKIGESYVFSAQTSPDTFEVTSNTLQRIGLVVQNSSSFNQTDSVEISGVAVMPGSVLKIDLTESADLPTVLQIDYEGDGRTDKRIELENKNQLQSSSTLPNNLLAHMIDDVLKQSLITESVIKTLDTYTYQQIFGKQIIKFSATLQGINSRIKSTKNSLEAKSLTYPEKRALLGQYQSLQKAEDRIGEYDRLYESLQIKGNVMKPIKIQSINKRRYDLARLFLVLADFDSKILELIEKHGSISSERLQRP